jgi:hypothetical protein
MTVNVARVIRIGLALLLLTAAGTAIAQEERSNDPELAVLEENVETFLQKVFHDDVDAQRALVELLRGSPLLKQTEAVGNLEKKTRDIPTLYGEMREAEWISTRRIGKSVVLVRYLANCENYPVVWHVTYYRSKRDDSPRNNDNWVVISLRYDTNVEQLVRNP